MCELTPRFTPITVCPLRSPALRDGARCPTLPRTLANPTRAWATSAPATSLRACGTLTSPCEILGELANEHHAA